MLKWTIIVLVLMMAVYAVAAGFYPVSFVNGYPIWQRDYEKTVAAAFAYYQFALTSYGEDLNSLKKQALELDLRRSVLDKLIEGILIRRYLSKELGDDLDKVVNNKLDILLADRDLAAISKLMNISYENLRDYLFVPQAERDILEGRFFLRGENFDQWLEDFRSEARILILLPNFSWEQTRVINKN